MSQICAPCHLSAVLNSHDHGCSWSSWRFWLIWNETRLAFCCANDYYFVSFDEFEWFLRAGSSIFDVSKRSFFWSVMLIRRRNFDSSGSWASTCVSLTAFSYLSFGRGWNLVMLRPICWRLYLLTEFKHSSHHDFALFNFSKRATTLKTSFDYQFVGFQQLSLLWFEPSPSSQPSDINYQ